MNYKKDMIEKPKNAIGRRMILLRGVVLTFEEIEEIKLFLNNILKPWELYCEDKNKANK